MYLPGEHYEFDISRKINLLYMSFVSIMKMTDSVEKETQKPKPPPLIVLRDWQLHGVLTVYRRHTLWDPSWWRHNRQRLRLREQEMKQWIQWRGHQDIASVIIRTMQVEKIMGILF